MTNQNALQVLSIDSNDESRQALRTFFADRPGLVLAGEATSSSDALQKLQSSDIDIALLDLGVPDMDSPGLIQQIRQSHPSVRVIIVTASDAPEDIFASMNAGADAYVLKGNLSAVLEIAIRSAKLGAVWLDPGIARQVLDVMQTAPTMASTRILPTGFMPMPLMPHETSILSDVAGSSCTDGVCMVDPSFIRKLKRFAATSA